MKLYIDSTDSDKLVIGLDEVKIETTAHQRASQKLLPEIQKLLKKEGKTLKDLTEIEVNPGPGSFTGIRVGISVANALGFTLGIPVTHNTPKYV